jgi:hypothetical protein
MELQQQLATNKSGTNTWINTTKRKKKHNTISTQQQPKVQK